MSHQPGHPGGETGLLQQEAAKFGIPLGGMPGAGAGGPFAGLMPNQEPVVTVSASDRRPTPGDPNRPYQVRTSPDTIKQVPLSAMLTQFDGFSAKQKQDLAKRMVRAGLLPEPPSGMTIDEWVKKIPLSQVRATYANLLEDTAERNASGQPTLTPVELLDQQVEYYKGNWKDGKVAGSEEDAPFTGVKKDRTIVTDIYNPTEARSLIRNVLKAELGREPTDDEFEDFRASLNAEMEDNPSVQISRQRYKDGEPVGPNRVTTRGGVDPSGYALEWAQSQPDWAEWQAVGTYFPTVMNMLGAGVPGT